MLVDEGSQKLLLTAGKKGILWKLDRTNGKFLDYVPTVFQNVFTSIDPQDRPRHLPRGYSASRAGRLASFMPGPVGRP